tara:strand:- start:3258 stop:4526 length:1269 start_codon:yes stop_codon:yes gene_type:complete
MTRLAVQDGYFLNPITGKAQVSVEGVITDSGTLSRNFYGSSNKLECWSLDSQYPHPDVPDATKQSNRCIDCPQNIRQSGLSNYKACKFFTTVNVILDNTNTVCELRVGGASLFAKSVNKMNLYKYIDYLTRNGETVHSVLTEIYLVHESVPKLYFKPSRPLAEDEMQTITRLVKADANLTNLFDESDDMKNTTYLLKNVTARYPRLDQPYRFDNKAGANGQTVPCDAMEDGAKYEMEFVMDEGQAKKLYSAMATAYKGAKDKSWPAKLEMPFKKQEDGSFIGKCNLKAAYNGRATGGPAQFDADNKRMDADFQLTTGSTINVALELVPYKMSSCGVSLRLRGVQVIDYAPMQVASPFEVEEGFTKGGDSDAEETAEDMFGVVEEDEAEEVKEPTKRPKKKVEKPDDDDDLSALLDEWGSDDD